MPSTLYSFILIKPIRDHKNIPNPPPAPTAFVNSIHPQSNTRIFHQDVPIGNPAAQPIIGSAGLDLRFEGLLLYYCGLASAEDPLVVPFEVQFCFVLGQVQKLDDCVFLLGVFFDWGVFGVDDVVGFLELLIGVPWTAQAGKQADNSKPNNSGKTNDPSPNANPHQNLPLPPRPSPIEAVHRTMEISLASVLTLLDGIILGVVAETIGAARVGAHRGQDQQQGAEEKLWAKFHAFLDNK